MNKIFELVLEALYLDAMIEITSMANRAQLAIDPECRIPCSLFPARLMEVAKECASLEHNGLPVSLFENQYFADAYEHMERLIDWEKEEWERIEEEKALLEAKKARILALIANEQWSELGFPSPAELSATLYKGNSYDVGCYYLIWDEDLVWYTNPYGCDGILCNEPTEQEMRSFLTNIALDDDYGPIPW